MSRIGGINGRDGLWRWRVSLLGGRIAFFFSRCLELTAPVEVYVIHLDVIMVCSLWERTQYTYFHIVRSWNIIHMVYLILCFFCRLDLDDATYFYGLRTIHFGISIFSQSLYTRSQSPGFSRDVNSNFGYPSMYRGKRFLVCTESVDVCVFAWCEFQFRICMYRVNRCLRVLVMWIPPPQYDFSDGSTYMLFTNDVRYSIVFYFAYIKICSYQCILHHWAIMYGWHRSDTSHRLPLYLLCMDMYSHWIPCSVNDVLLSATYDVYIDASWWMCLDIRSMPWWTVDGVVSSSTSGMVM